jgi:hypothetical protein
LYRPKVLVLSFDAVYTPLTFQSKHRQLKPAIALQDFILCLDFRAELSKLPRSYACACLGKMTNVDLLVWGPFLKNEH